MAQAVNPRRSYDSSRRQEQASETRRAVLDTARQLFLAEGYASTTVTAIAEGAGVSVETIYKIFRNKPGVVKALVDVALVGDDEPVPMVEREFVQRIEAEPDPHRKLALYGDHTVDIGIRTSALELVVRDAAVSDPGAAEVWDKLQNERLIGMGMFARHLADSGCLRQGVSVNEARDVLWVHNSLELWDLLVHQRRWKPKRFGRWIGDQLVAALL
jgi:AcrR family transcriptional regulator